MNKKIPVTSSILTVKSKDGSLVSLDDEKASLFNFFQNVYIDDNGFDLHTDCFFPVINICRTLK